MKEASFLVENNRPGIYTYRMVVAVGSASTASFYFSFPFELRSNCYIYLM